MKQNAQKKNQNELKQQGKGMKAQPLLTKLTAMYDALHAKVCIKLYFYWSTCGIFPVLP